MADGVTEVSVSKERVETFLRSAAFWVNELPKCEDRQQGKADWWAIASGALAAFTGHAVFPAITPGCGQGEGANWRTADGWRPAARLTQCLRSNASSRGRCRGDWVRVGERRS